MSVNYLIFMAAMTASLAAMMVAWVRTILFFRHYKEDGRSLFNPLHGLALWKRLVTRGGFGPEGERERRGTLRTYGLALALFALAIFLFYWLPAVPRG